ncbi:RNA 2'-phosphotransferase [Nocardioides sp. YIM B13467]|uniref:RNA 2'-phosphotransferase n=1 Tax=Nocardioides sp. YIM B13467 TaxID=3366294 RepID=UPI003670CCC8
MDKTDVRRSKRLSQVLRHRPESVGIELDPRGWVDLPSLLDALAAHGSPMTRDDIDRVVRGNEKQRFEVDATLDRIRARQGHTVEVDLDLTPSEPPAVLFHGTPRTNIESILASGLDRRRRHHVHLSPDRETAERVGATADVVHRLRAKNVESDVGDQFATSGYAAPAEHTGHAALIAQLDAHGVRL